MKSMFINFISAFSIIYGIKILNFDKPKEGLSKFMVIKDYKVRPMCLIISPLVAMYYVGYFNDIPKELINVLDMFFISALFGIYYFGLEISSYLVRKVGKF